MKRYLLITLIAAAAAIGAQAQATTKLTATKSNDYGIVYSLPTTLLDITIETEFTERTPGEFFNYANRSLNMTDAITSYERKAKIKSVTIVPRGVANPDNRYNMEFKGGNVVNVYLNDANLPIGINTDKLPITLKAPLPTPQAAEPTPLETPAARQAITQDMTLSSSVSKRAQLAAERIFELRENRSDLISGQAENTPPDGKSMQLALDNLSAQEAALTAMFIGTEKKWTEVNTLTYTPGDEDVSNVIIGRISPIDGLVDEEDLSGEPIYLSMEVLSQGEVPLDDKGQPKPFPKNGVAYQVPGSALITLNFQGKQVASQEVDLAQLGVTFGLDPKIFTDKKAPAYLILESTTGAIVTLGIKE